MTGAGGFALNERTVASLSGIDLASTPPPRGAVRRALLLGRDGGDPDERLSGALGDGGTNVTIAPGHGYATMIAPPQDAVPPRAVFAEVDRWLDDGEGAPTGTRAPAAGIEPIDAGAEMRLTVDGLPVSERPMAVISPHGHLFGVLAQPVGARTDVGAILLNAGMIHRTGPNRMWVELARSWAARGVPTLRLDFREVGDAEGQGSGPYSTASLYDDPLVDQLQAAIDSMAAMDMGERFVLVGLCSGSYWAFRGALKDERVTAALMLNPRVLVWDRLLDVRRDLRRALREPSQWRRLGQHAATREHFRRQARELPSALFSTVRGMFARRTPGRGGDQLDASLDRLREQDTALLLAFSGEEPLQEELQRQGRLTHLDRWPNLQLGVLPGRDHTLRPVEAQSRARELLDSALDREIARGPRPAAPSSAAESISG
jgi:hypothetical protein